ncbi:MAG TPA: dienelactone hydrolase family protein [Cellvibrionaceae bacterium]|nr:dienelactone hydrolase family protein [Cellvibrionaceae bacterium]HMW73991.1 dienelactone hydrolase family protein [Cellvibrionaceae bacterium]HMY39741.1 dienelactone hydrolase family protein [Marinagarivorans sp.]HNG60032.1 dienelactone hydrolase family protein [Cellvibrionaceae bacterium]
MLPTEQGKTYVLIRDKRAPCDVLYFGGNAEAVDASQRDLERAFSQCNILSMIYRGYGLSEGTPSQAHLYADALALYRLRQAKTREFIIVGRSLGTSLATYLASQVPVKQLVLVTPFDSMANLVSDKFPWLPTGLLLKNPFPSAEYARHVTAPVHILLAEEDEIIPTSHTLALQKAFIRTQPQLTRLGKVGHNTVDEHPAYIQVLGRRL